ncbi:rhox homeobox family member 1-like [Rattus norvegicus]|uniref:rhox homeobox family member 1-like n=1 Tax=Rattus norvegicus TaxID=10116 RepID=UPI0000DA448E|nr:rhox homeobox family member 1-like [Rattus norvegicus]|eukprot:XP_001077477.1 PREDICTED: rhox homeobox family member 1-like [Rattus norvegicus]
MAYKKYFFDFDYYGVDFYEEEVTTELQQGRAATADGSHTEEVIGILKELSYMNAVLDHNYNRPMKSDTRGNPQEPAQEEEEPVFQKPTTYYRKLKFTPEQLLELDRVFEETQYPDALQRKELAKLINVEEYTVKIWFNKRRAKIRKHQKALPCTNILPDKQNYFPMRVLKETKNVVVLQEPPVDEFFCSQPHVGHPNWQ